MKHIKLFEAFKKKKGKDRGDIHTLSGIALIVEGKLLLVLAKKYLGQDNKWSLPKGHIEGDSLDSALKELEEETGIHLDKNYDEMLDVEYLKGGSIKLMDIYVYHRSLDDVKSYLSVDDKWMVDPSHYDSGEVIKAKFYSLDKCRTKLDIGMVNILEEI